MVKDGKMKAGSELNALMATEVMGWELLTVGYFDGPDETPRQVELDEWLYEVGAMSVGDYWIDVPNNVCIAVEDWHPSTDIKLAMKVVEKLCNWDVDDNMLILKGQGPDLREHEELDDDEGRGWWEAEINGDFFGSPVKAKAETASMAICLVGLKVVEIE